MLRFVRPERPTLGFFEGYGAIGALGLVAAVVVPFDQLFPRGACWFHRFFGIPCGTCGMTRAFRWFATGRFVDSIAINPIAFLAACLSALAVLYVVIAPLRPPRVVWDLTPREGNVIRAVAIVGFASNWVYLIATGV